MAVLCSVIGTWRSKWPNAMWAAVREDLLSICLSSFEFRTIYGWVMYEIGLKMHNYLNFSMTGGIVIKAAGCDVNI